MIDITALDRDLTEIVVKRNEIADLDYNDERYDELEEALHDLEDDFQEKYGEYLEDALDDVHEKLNLTSDVLHPVAYVAKKYKQMETGQWLPYEGGVPVELEEAEEAKIKLVMVPQPTRLVLVVGQGALRDVWVARKS